MNLLIIGVSPCVVDLLRNYIATLGGTGVRVHSSSIEDDMSLQSFRWDVVIVGSEVQSHPELALQVKKNRISGLKVILTDKESLQSSIDFWGTAVYSYLLKPVNRHLFQLLWQNMLERVKLSKKLSRLAKKRKKGWAGSQEQQEVFKDLFASNLKLQGFFQEKEDFLARTAHELLTPLTALQGYLDLLASGKPGEVNELQSDVLNCCLDLCRRLQRLAISLTDLVALDRGSSTLHLDKGDINECLTRAVSELGKRFEEKRLHFQIETDSAIPRFKFDRDRLSQVFINLLENALKFTPTGGTIQVRTSPHFWERRTVGKKVYKAQERRGNGPNVGFNSIRISVEDTGPGIPAEFLQEIFEEYSRVRNGNGNGSPHGFGLGLAIARRVVLAHQGKIWAENKPEQGSCFTVLIPITA